MAAVRASAVLAGLFALTLFTLPAASVNACPFCVQQGSTLLGDYKEASAVLVGTFANAKLDPNGNFGEGTTDFTVEKVLKSHASVANKKILTIPKYIPKTDKKFLIFFDVYKDVIEPY